MLQDSAHGDGVNRVRVLVANRPRLMRELVLATITDQLDVEVVGETDETLDITRVVEEKHPDVVIVALEAQTGSFCALLLEHHPELKIIAIALEHNRAMLYWASPDLQSIPVECSEEGILSAVRCRTFSRN
jgi:AmiR/NasT family two-component response regulator